MIRRILRRWADASLRSELTDMETEHDATKRRLVVAEAEIESMAAVIARDRARIEAETAIHRRRQADAEGVTNNDDSAESRIRRFLS